MRILAVLGLLISCCNPNANLRCAERVTLFAPAGLSACADAAWYRQQFGLPAVFDRYAYRESRCLNDRRSPTGCCVGIYQLNVNLHMSDSRMAPLYAACGITSEADVFGQEPIKRRRQTCAAKALYSVVGLSPWRS